MVTVGELTVERARVPPEFKATELICPPLPACMLFSLMSCSSRRAFSPAGNGAWLPMFPRSNSSSFSYRVIVSTSEIYYRVIIGLIYLKEPWKIVLIIKMII